MAYEESKYEVIRSEKNYEIRHYADRLVVQTDLGAGSSAAFRRLFRYITGANRSAAKVSMTVPVMQSEKVQMTVPVQQAELGGGMVMQFYLPAKFTLETAPTPTDPAVRLNRVAGGDFAVIRYAGRSSDRRFQAQSKILQDALKADGLKVRGAPSKATYNAPFTPYFLRRNEAMVEISAQ